MYYFVMYEWALSSYGTFQEEVWVELWQNKIYSQSSLSKSGHFRKLNFVIFVANSFQIIIFLSFLQKFKLFVSSQPEVVTETPCRILALDTLISSAGDFLCSGKIWILYQQQQCHVFGVKKHNLLFFVVVFIVHILLQYYCKMYTHIIFIYIYFLNFQKFPKICSHKKKEQK